MWALECLFTLHLCWVSVTSAVQMRKISGMCHSKISLCVCVGGVLGRPVSPVHASLDMSVHLDTPVTVVPCHQLEYVIWLWKTSVWEQELLCVCGKYQKIVILYDLLDLPFSRSAILVCESKMYIFNREENLDICHGILSKWHALP